MEYVIWEGIKFLKIECDVNQDPYSYLLLRKSEIESLAQGDMGEVVIRTKTGKIHYTALKFHEIIESGDDMVSFRSMMSPASYIDSL